MLGVLGWDGHRVCGLSSRQLGLELLAWSCPSCPGLWLISFRYTTGDCFQVVS